VGTDAGVSLTLTAGTASVLAQLLDFLAELPSTPDLIRSEARERAGSIEEALPPARPQPHAGARQRGGVVVLERVPATAIAGLLELLAELPSTPPSVAEEARAHSERLWDELTKLAAAE
jgi:hypothetical protein